MSVEKTLLQTIGRTLDHLIAADLTARGVVDALFEAARSDALARSQSDPRARQEPAAGQAPPSLLATVAGALAGRLGQAGPGTRAILATGYPSRSWMFDDLTETDGPVGVAVLARVLEEAWGVVPVVVTGRQLVPVVAATLRSAGLIVGTLEQALRSKPGPPAAAATAVVPFTSNQESAVSEAQALLEQVVPALALSVETPDRAADGNYHNVSGREVPPRLVAAAHVLFTEARKRGVLTVGIGDGGNELGMGNLAPDLSRWMEGAGAFLARTEVDLAIAAAVSNTGAFGLAASLAAAAGRPDVLDRIDVGRVIERCSDAGAVEGVSSRVDPMSDGVPLALNRALWDLMRFAVAKGLKGWQKL
ncbi:glutamate cyclase domain-containing protein [Limnochorda pilosa]|uniref:D-glutamate cyclase-like C-terminal domain-containing protein n=1 Tax=Limnochorda pilosa TaxID=1555112 RepID=A0A0K2SLS3_LIMPI|nr:glutamate cyclase domain-containing protein [Limnochorda pilosa]BAS28068.1 hypothetical protein LIP_2227 [Limnochorda pilosa]